MKNKIGLLMLTILTISTLAALPIPIKAGAGGNPATLRLSADKGFYVGKDPDPWISESWIVTDIEFTLYVYAKNWPAKNVYLAIAVNDTSKINSITVGSTTVYASDFTHGTVQWPADAGGDTIPPHGVYPTYYALVKFGNVNNPYDPNTYWASVDVKIDASVPVKIHFDAQGIMIDEKGRIRVCFCPFSHDLTCLPSSIPPEQLPSIYLVKSANVTMAHVGDGIEYTYEVSNTGNVPLSGVYVEDSLGVTVNYVSGDTDGDGLLDTDETWIFEAEYTVLESNPDELTNTATAHGTYDTTTVSATDSYTVTILKPAISVEKSGPEYAHEGDTITYNITVKNTGNCPLYNVVVEDKALDFEETIDELDVGEEVVFEVDYTVPSPSGDITNTVTASGKDILNYEVSDSAEWKVDVLHPSIDVIKTANVSMIHEGGWVKYNVTVVNTGDCDLTVTLEDELLGISWTGTLRPGEKYEVIKSIQPTEDPTENTASATGIDPLGRKVSDSASWSVDILCASPPIPPPVGGFIINSDLSTTNCNTGLHFHSLSLTILTLLSIAAILTAVSYKSKPKKKII